MRTIGFAGTAKNTGKTTTALKILEESAAAGFTNAITSIGLDGEDKDQVTGLPKPRYYLKQGDVVVTAESCLNYATAAFESILATPIHTSLGQIYIVRVTQPGSIALAGPNRRSDLLHILEHLEKLDIDLVVIDGALNRIVPMICSDGLVFATGAAFDEDIDALAEHASALMEMFDPPTSCKQHNGFKKICLLNGDKPITEMDTGSMLGIKDVQKILSLIHEPFDTLVIPGVCYPRHLESLIKELPVGKIQNIIFGNPLKLIASGTPLRWKTLFSDARQGGVNLSYLEKVPVLMLTVNPFFPCYDPATFSYQPALVDAEELLVKVRSVVQSLPVYNLLQPPIPNLCQLIGLALPENQV
jgi:hypothetical protein